MRLYFQAMKNNIFLLLITVVLLFLTVGFWFGIPLYGLADFFYESDVPRWFQIIFTVTSVGFCFSLFFIPLHVAIAKQYASKKQTTMVKSFSIMQGTLIVLVSILVVVFFLIVNIMEHGISDFYK